MFCPRCGAESPADVRYCHACGAELPRQADEEPAAGSSRRSRAGERLGRLVGRTRRERVVSALIAVFLVIAVIGFIALDPVEDDDTRASRESLDAACLAAKSQIVDAANALAEPRGPERYALEVVVTMMDLRDVAGASGLDGAEGLRAAALGAAVAAGRVGRLAREEASASTLSEAVQDSAAALEDLSSPTTALKLERCASATFDRSE